MNAIAALLAVLARTVAQQEAVVNALMILRRSKRTRYTTNNHRAQAGKVIIPRRYRKINPAKRLCALLRQATRRFLRLSRRDLRFPLPLPG